ncbi:MAG: iron ABC transporter permease [Synergistes jonesii]|uniref:FecCD family ABC transporter permease n=1 Tax=Synergistes jonesii TaxID=2754 RepID=UPI002A754CFD|nr:iron ABC transporter permease [Synergistes jonesii]MDY2985687.1 iron ABC transporter permease [Synergistes jonesii]
MNKKIILLFIISGLIIIAAPFVGAHMLSPSDILGGGGSARILWDLRLPRVTLGWISGATLAVCGLIFQALFRNPLASPDMLGVSMGAAFGAVLYIRLGIAISVFGVIQGISLAAFGGAFLAIMALYAAGNIRRGGLSLSSLLLAGVALNFLFGSVNMIIQYSGGYTDTFRMMRWTMGGLQTVGFAPALASLPGLLIILLVGWLTGPQLDLFICVEELAQSRGVSVAALRRLLFLTVSFVVGISVALCGPIGFVGLMCPHICRHISGGGHRELTVVCALFGGAFLVACDVASRTFWAPAELPVGIITSCLGSLFFLYLLVNGER